MYRTHTGERKPKAECKHCGLEYSWCCEIDCLLLLENETTSWTNEIIMDPVHFPYIAKLLNKEMLGVTQLKDSTDPGLSAIKKLYPDTRAERLGKSAEI